MPPDSARSEKVVEAYKRHKLTHSALRRIREVLIRIEQERLADVRLAWIGIGLIAVLLLVWLAFIFGNEQITL